MQSNEIDKLKIQHKIAKGIGLFFLSSIFLYGFAAYWFLNRPQEPTFVSDAAGMQKYLYFLLSAISCCMIPVLKPVIINGRGLPKEYREVKPDYPQAASRLLTATIISYALAEVPAFFGLVLALLTHQMKDFYILAAVSFGLILVNLPKWEEWENGIKKMILV